MSDEATGLISRDEFLAPCKMPTKDVPLPELGEGKSMRVKGLTGHEWSAYEAGMLDDDGFKDKSKWKFARERLIVFAAIDTSGERLFRMEDIPAIGKKLHGVILRLTDAINELSGRFAVGNSPPTTDDEPPSD